MFIRKGWDVYNSDAVERGRSGFRAARCGAGEPNFLTAGQSVRALPHRARRPARGMPIPPR